MGERNGATRRIVPWRKRDHQNTPGHVAQPSTATPKVTLRTRADNVYLSARDRNRRSQAKRSGSGTSRSLIQRGQRSPKDVSETLWSVSGDHGVVSADEGSVTADEGTVTAASPVVPTDCRSLSVAAILGKTIRWLAHSPFPRGCSHWLSSWHRCS